jgi:tetratricopeptide (TPR) repeat protein
MVDGLMVTSRTSSFAFKGKNTDVREIARQLGVKNILEGSVRKHGNKVRVTAQLINASDGYHKWSRVYDSSLEDIFAVQNEIALAITEQVKHTFNTFDSSKNLVKTPTENIDAYNLYLKGLYYWNKWIPQEVMKAIQFFEDALKLSPSFAPAYSRLSACYIYLGAVGSMPNKVAYPKAKEYALKAVEIDDSLIDSHLSVGMVNYFNDWDWEGSQKCFLRALEINPNSAETHQYYAMLLMTLGHFKKAVKEAETAQQLDPLNAPISQILAFAYFNLNQVDEAIMQHEKTKEIEPGFKDAWSSLAWIYLKQGEFEKAIELFFEVENIPGFKAKAISGLGYLYAKKGDKEKAADYLKQLEAMNSEELPLDMELAIIHTGLDNMDKTFDYLESAFEKRLGGMNFIKGRYWKEIHEHPRFKNLLQKMNLPDE